VNEARYAKLFGLSLAAVFALVLVLHAVAISEASLQGLQPSVESEPELRAGFVTPVQP
jgi:hypothetical protein